MYYRKERSSCLASAAQQKNEDARRTDEKSPSESNSFALRGIKSLSLLLPSTLSSASLSLSLSCVTSSEREREREREKRYLRAGSSWLFVSLLCFILFCLFLFDFYDRVGSQQPAAAAVVPESNMQEQPPAFGYSCPVAAALFRINI